MTRATVTRIIPYLVESDLLRADQDGTYSLGLELVGLASRVGWVDHCVRRAGAPRAFA